MTVLNVLHALARLKISAGCTAGHLLVLLLCSLTLEASNAQQANGAIVVDPLAQATLESHFRNSVDVMAEGLGDLGRGNGNSTWAGVVRIPPHKNRAAGLYAALLIASKDQSGFRVDALSSLGKLQDCEADCKFDVEMSSRTNEAAFSWWTTKDDGLVHSRTTTYFAYKQGHWTAVTVKREDWSERDGSNNTIIVSKGGRRSIANRTSQGNYVSGRSGAPLNVSFEQYVVNRHWSEAAPPLTK